MSEMTLATLIQGGATAATELVKGGASFVAELYSANPIGQFIVVAGIASTVIGVGRSLFLKRKHV